MTCISLYACFFPLILVCDRRQSTLASFDNSKASKEVLGRIASNYGCHEHVFLQVTALKRVEVPVDLSMC